MSNPIPFPTPPAPDTPPKATLCHELPGLHLSATSMVHLSNVRHKVEESLLATHGDAGESQPDHQSHLIFTRDEAFTLIGTLIALHIPQPPRPPRNVVWMPGAN